MYMDVKNRRALAGRRGIAGLLAVLLLLGAVGCHNDTPPVEGDSSVASDTTVPGDSSMTGDTTIGDGTDVTTGDGTTTGNGSTSSSGSTGSGSSGTTSVPTTTPPLSGDFSIVKDGKATSTIVISTNASDKVREAAEDLQASIQKMSGATIPIGYDSVDRTNGNFILVGPSKYTELLGIEQPTGYPDNEKVILKRAGNYLVLMGNDDQAFIGTQYAVTMFLEKQGCGWFGPDELWQVYPSTQNISVGSLDIEHTPKFTHRRTRVNDSAPNIADRWYMGGMKSMTGHFLPTIIPKATYFQTHPEWFSLIDGKRDASATWWQYCYSNEAFAEEVAKKVIEEFDRNPDLESIPVTPNDGWNDDWCECSECSKYASYTDVVLEFANRVARQVAKKYPNKTISILSYHATWFAPKTVKAEPNVEVMFCRETSMTSPIEDGLYMGDTRDPITQNIYKTSWKDNFLSYIQSASVQNVSIWEWYCIAADKKVWKDIPWVQGDVAIRNQNFWKANGAEYIFYDSGPLAAYSETNKDFPLRWPLWYVAAKGMWDASLTGDEILMDACTKLYGNAANEMYGYYQALATASEECTAYSMTWVPPEPSQMYTVAQIRKIDSALAKAKGKLNSVTADQKARMENQISLWEDAKELF